MLARSPTVHTSYTDMMQPFPFIEHNKYKNDLSPIKSQMQNHLSTILTLGVKR